MKKKKIATLMCIFTLTASLLACGSANQTGTENKGSDSPGIAKESLTTVVDSITGDATTNSAGTETDGSNGNLIQNYIPSESDRSEEIYCTDMATSDVAAAPAEYPASYRAEEGEYPDFNTEEYDYIKENSFLSVSTSPLSTFAADVDTGSYTNFRRMLRDGYTLEQIPQGAVRAEEMINYFEFDFENNLEDNRFSVSYESNTCPWNEEHELLAMTVTANEVDFQSTGNNFVFLIDSSGSMRSPDKGTMAIESFKLLAETLTEDDRVSIVTYSGSSQTVLDSCPGHKYEKICNALDKIEFGGGTNGSGGITAAYELAEENFMEYGNNRVIIASDGDMNLGITSQAGLTELISEQKETGIFLTVLGYGSGNYSDANMESLADCGNGNYYYIDCLEEAQRVLVEKMKQTTITVAKDVKLQVEFNPLEVSEYRLIGYENRTMAAEDFTDDTKDGGETGAGQTVTVLYELKRNYNDETTSELKYQGERPLTENALNGELLTLSIRYKKPDADKSAEENFSIKANSGTFRQMSRDFSFAAGMAQLSMILNDSAYLGEATYASTLELLENGTSRYDDLRMELLQMLPYVD